MTAINFKAQFADLIANGEKRQTIRKRGKQTPRPGQTLQLYTGQRTKSCRLLKEATCIEVLDFQIINRFERRLNGELLSFSDSRDLAIADGFDGIKAMHEFFEELYGLPFEGVLIRW